MKKVPLRTCVITKEKCEKRSLLRVVRTPEGKVIFDKTGKSNGKGAYVKKDSEVIKKARNTKALEKILEISIPEEIYDELLKEVTNE